MIVLVDAGNSRIKLGWLEPASGAREDAALALAYDAAALRGGDQTATLEAAEAALDAWLAPQLDAWLRGLPAAPARALGVTVAAPAVGRVLETALQRHGCALAWQRPGPAAAGLRNGYARPGQLGADRWAALLGLRARLPAGHGPALLASFGTATTLDAIGPDDVFPGGLILPGPALMLASLANGTANLPLAGGAAVDFPVDTHQAIATGVAAAQAGALLRQWLAAWQRYGAPPEVYVTGGDWRDVADESRRLLADTARHRGIAPPAVRELANPVLDGLAEMARGRQQDG